VEKEVYDKKMTQAQKQQKDELWNQVVAATEVIKYPDKEVERVKTEMQKQYEEYAKQSEMSFEDFLKKQLNLDKKTFDEQMKAYAEGTVKEEMIVYAIADKEKISISDKEYKKFIEDQLKSYGFTEKQFEEANGKSYEEALGENNIKKQAYMEADKKFILDNAKIIK
ncbi:MAG: hypothetical protein ACRCUS_03380, partial [Anaerovoracaceae bacterium]